MLYSKPTSCPYLTLEAFWYFNEEYLEPARIPTYDEQEKLLEDMPVYVDKMDNKVDQTYVAWPTRIYFLDKEGRVKYDSGLGPYGFSPSELDQEIAAYLETNKGK